MDSSATIRQKALPNISYPLNLLHLSDLDTITEMRSSAEYHKVNQALKNAHRAKQATKPWVPSPRSVHMGQWTLGDRSVFASVVSKHSAAASTASSPFKI